MSSKTKSTVIPATKGWRVAEAVFIDNNKPDGTFYYEEIIAWEIVEQPVGELIVNPITALNEFSQEYFIVSPDGSFSSHMAGRQSADEAVYFLMKRYERSK